MEMRSSPLQLETESALNKVVNCKNKIHLATALLKEDIIK
jgi:hypothetical protein